MSSRQVFFKKRRAYKQISEAAITMLQQKYSICLFNIYNNNNEVARPWKIWGRVLQHYCPESFIKVFERVQNLTLTIVLSNFS